MNKFISTLKRASPTLLTIAGAAGVIGTAVLAVKATPEACRAIRRKEIEVNEKEPHPEDDRDLTIRETVAVAWKYYIPAASVGLATIICIFASNGLNHRQQGALTSAYMLVDQAYKEYKKKVSELYGEEAHDKVTQSIARDKYAKSAHSDNPNALLFFDFFSGRYLERTMEEIIDAEYQLNRKMALEDSVTVNDFYELLGIDPIDFGDVLGWSFGASESYYGYQWIDFTHELSVMDDGLECYILHMVYPPTADFMDYC